MIGPLDAPGAPSQRESAKAGRRDRIVNATWELLREVGADETSLKAIAERAAVSRSTLFNLFENKTAILQQVYNRDLRQYEALVAAEPSADALDRIFDALGVAARLYTEDPGFYRATMWLSPSGPDSESYSVLRDPRIAFWRRMIEAAEAEGFLVLGDRARVVGLLFSQIARGILADWVAGVISAERLRQETGFGFAVAMTPYATSLARARLKARRREFEASLRVPRSGA